MMKLWEKNSGCTACPLRANCNQVVTGQGNEKAKLFIIGEYPTEDDDTLATPFNGRGYDYLKKLLKKSDIKPADIYWSYTVKCRVKSSPKDEEIAACKTWLWQELKAVTPKSIITLGKIPARLLLKLKKTFSLQSYAGTIQVVPYLGAKIYPWYSPFYILNQGKSFEEKTIEFFTEVRKSYETT